uniref:Uncharacterized protein n=1 Tax=Arundo donax TaxID=35708 RepID=A0A0A9AKM3_ARUDO
MVRHTHGSTLAVVDIRQIFSVVLLYRHVLLAV